ncbi:Piwi domain-containing protein [Clostridium butyricum]|uniref:Piwi domain-containing protein n=1 Tax=Clostridium butyricum TaxID=1492 RepID=UPI0005EAE2B1|nr:Piwi domain-containing protein [Clostridium butyricum]
MNNLTFEAFEGIGQLNELNFYKYRLIGKGQIDNVHQAIWSVKYKLQANNFFKPVFVKGEILYSLDELKVIPEFENVEVILDGNIILSISENTDIYKDVIVFYINNALKNIKDITNYRKYITKNTDEIICKSILTTNLKYQYMKSEKGFKLQRKFKISPVVFRNGKVILYLNCSSDFSTDKSIYEMLNDGLGVVGLQVKNKWTNANGNIFIEKVLDNTISDPGTSGKLGQSLIDYYINGNQKYRVEKFTDEDKNAKVIQAKIKNKTYNYIPQALTPVITREYLSHTDKKFSKQIENVIKMDMNYRYQTLKSFVEDIGVIKELNNLHFKNQYYTNFDFMGFESGVLEEPVLMGANGKIKDKKQIFINGFFKNPKENVKFGVLYPEGCMENAQSIARSILDFATAGKYNKQENKYISKNLMNIGFKPSECIFESYKLGDITEYKATARKLKEHEKVGFVIAVIPDMNELEVENPYNPFKKVWAKLNIPSQMITLKTTEKFKNIVDKSGLYYLHNIALNILGKIGGIPWIIKDMPGNIDCFIGLDVGTREKGIHFPACSVLFDKYGKLINYYKPTIPQSGEKIAETILQEIFDNVLISYKEENGEYPKNIVIHRDGFSRENIDWYKEYFDKKGIKFNIIEVKKNIPVKIAKVVGSNICNPIKGSYVLKNDKAFIVTTDIKDGVASPNPLKIEKTYGDVEMKSILEQIYSLSQIHVGSTKSLRLPITTGYADKICKAIEYIPQGVVDNRLFFL